MTLAKALGVLDQPWRTQAACADMPTDRFHNRDERKAARKKVRG